MEKRRPGPAAHTHWWEIAEVVFGIPLLAAVALQWAVPLAIPGALRAPALAAGALLIVAGIAVIVSARREMARRGQPTDPGKPTSALVTTGIFSWSRNPMYLGAACLLLGIALAGDLVWLGALLVPALAACHIVLIAPEERYLAAVFGEEYRAYAATVRRWLGRRSGVR